MYLPPACAFTPGASCHLALSTGALLEYVASVAVVIVLSIAGVWGVMMFRKRMLEDEPMTGGSPFSISELKRLREEGLLTPAEYERTRAAMIGAVNKEHFPGPSNAAAPGPASNAPKAGERPRPIAGQTGQTEQSGPGGPTRPVSLDQPARGGRRGPMPNPPTGDTPPSAFPGDTPLPELPPPPPPPTPQPWDDKPGA